ncbi:helix-turn-helix domain-containing protein [Streptococcus sp. S784/96/1]|uniref:helix-turn-helix domain-containing protein n=1 Tax=Streptococcus sp. S784/96/1 TaxID=2653499 RepID=UPI001EE43741|nr:helix-turn-helix transcriptional regulator [Streptococcus sp. S784/96/1]
MNRLKELRKEKKLSQKEIADILGFPLRSYQRMENGESQIKTDKAQLLADYFKVSVGYLLGYELSRGFEDYFDFIEQTESSNLKKAVKNLGKENIVTLKYFFEKELAKQYSPQKHAKYYKDSRDYIDNQMLYINTSLMGLPDSIVELILYWANLDDKGRESILNLIKALAEALKEER